MFGKRREERFRSFPHLPNGIPLKTPRFPRRQALALGQFSFEREFNEIAAIPSLLEMLEPDECIAPIEAMGLRKEIFQGMVDCRAGNLLQVLPITDASSRARSHVHVG